MSRHISRLFSSMPKTSVLVLSTIASYREWRRKAYDKELAVGYVATMGALHAGHLSLVRRSLAENNKTVVSIFVNPAQFAPHEDLATYPRTLPQDVEALSAETVDGKTVDIVFAPNAREMYPSGITQDVAEQKGAFIEVKGFSHQMEGKSRPTFFRGVATVVTKLFNVIEPTNTYFGQKDIQQALLLRRLCRDLLMSHPTPDRLHIVPTARDPVDNLALSSRNAYLTEHGRSVAGTLNAALTAAERAWHSGKTKEECISFALSIVQERKLQAAKDGLSVEMRLDYIEMNDSQSFEVVKNEARRDQGETSTVLLSGALWVDKTRLIDNIILGDVNAIVR